MIDNEVPHVTVIIDGMERRIPAHLANSRAFKIHGARLVREQVAPTKITAPEVISEDEVSEEVEQSEAVKRGRPRKSEA
jgi:hypothetical protein